MPLERQAPHLLLYPSPHRTSPHLTSLASLHTVWVHAAKCGRRHAPGRRSGQGGGDAGYDHAPAEGNDTALSSMS